MLNAMVMESLLTMNRATLIRSKSVWDRTNRDGECLNQTIHVVRVNILTAGYETGHDTRDAAQHEHTGQ